MTDDEIRAEITKQIHDTLVLLVAALRDQATHGAPMSKKTLGRAADAVQEVGKNESLLRRKAQKKK